MDERDLLVSIVIPLYNHARFVRQAVESLIAQAHPTLELIIIDDGSSDDSVAAVEAIRPACEARFQKFTLVTQPNRGVAATLNRGIKLATGSFVFLLASDDIAKPLAIQTFLSEMIKDNYIALVCGDLDLIDEAGEVTTLVRDGKPFTSFIEYITAHRTDIDLVNRFGTYETLIYGNYLTVGILLRRQSVLDVGGYDETCSMEDLDLWLKLARHYRFIFVPLALAQYRQHSNNTIVRQGHRILFDELNLLLREFDECVARGLMTAWRDRVAHLIAAVRETALENQRQLEVYKKQDQSAVTTQADENDGLLKQILRRIGT